MLLVRGESEGEELHPQFMSSRIHHELRKVGGGGGGGMAKNRPKI